ncbi:MAG: LuxR C-terminal-related transcriptional regulator [Phycisphaerales bacterium]
MGRPELPLFSPMSPDAFAPFDGLGGLCALARDAQFRLVWCNEEYARQIGETRESLIGSSPGNHLPVGLATERITHMRRVLETGRMVAFYQVWNGARWHTRIWPLDPKAFGKEGCFIVMSRALEPEPEEGEARAAVLAPAVDLGDLAVLTKRELEVYYYLASGLTTAQIADTLYRSPKTIGRHIGSIHAKMGYTKRSDVVRDATKRGLIAFSPDEWMRLVDPPKSSST